jgi:hypothetical protein
VLQEDVKTKVWCIKKQTDCDSDSDETEEFAKITAMQSLNESLE